MQCLKVGLTSYALETKAELKTMMSSVMFAKFEREFNRAMAEIESNDDVW